MRDALCLWMFSRPLHSPAPRNGNLYLQVTSKGQTPDCVCAGACFLPAFFCSGVDRDKAQVLPPGVAA